MMTSQTSSADRIGAERRRADLIRQVGVISAFCFMIIAAMVGTGLLGGTPVQDLQDGALDVDGSYLAPARPAFSIWTVIYIGLGLYTVWQALPGRRADARQRQLGWLIAGTMVLNGLWLVAAQFATLPLTVLAIVVLLVVLGITFCRAVLDPPQGWSDRLLVDGVTGLHLGWVALATVANTAAWLTSILPASAGDDADLWGVLVLVVVGVIGILVGWMSGWRLAPALAMSWGTAWIGVARLTGEPESGAIGVTAFVVAGAILVAAIAGAAVRGAASVRNAEA